MKRTLPLFFALSLCISLVPANAQMGGPGRAPSGPDFSGPMAKLFGDNSAFSAAVEVQAKADAETGQMIMPGRISYLDGKSRFEMNLAELKGANLPPDAMDQMKEMGMDKLATVSVPDQKLVYLIYPGLKAYAEMPVKGSDGGKSEKDFTVEITELGKESINGQECIKNKAVVTDKEGKTTEFTVWNAPSLKKFPLKIETTGDTMPITMSFKDVKFAKPDAGLFSPPSDFTKYDTVMGLMQGEMMKRMSPGK